MADPPAPESPSQAPVRHLLVWTLATALPATVATPFAHLGALWVPVTALAVLAALVVAVVALGTRAGVRAVPASAPRVTALGDGVAVRLCPVNGRDARACQGALGGWALLAFAAALVLSGATPLAWAVVVLCGLVAVAIGSVNRRLVTLDEQTAAVVDAAARTLRVGVHGAPVPAADITGIRATASGVMVDTLDGAHCLAVPVEDPAVLAPHVQALHDLLRPLGAFSPTAAIDRDRARAALGGLKLAQRGVSGP